jgi:hypothetical protein
MVPYQWKICRFHCKFDAILCDIQYTHFSIPFCCEDFKFLSNLHTFLSMLPDMHLNFKITITCSFFVSSYKHTFFKSCDNLDLDQHVTFLSNINHVHQNWAAFDFTFKYKHDQTLISLLAWIIFCIGAIHKPDQRITISSERPPVSTIFGTFFWFIWFYIFFVKYMQIWWLEILDTCLDFTINKVSISLCCFVSKHKGCGH